MAKGVKTRNIDSFREGLMEYAYGRCSQAEAAKIAGMSVPTFRKYANMHFLGIPFPDTLFKARFIIMSMAEVIKSIEREALREAQSHEIGGRNGEPIETSELHDMTIGIDISVDAVNEYAKSILGRYPKNNYEFSRALAMKILEETKSLANSEGKK